MDIEIDYEEAESRFLSNWSGDYLDDLDTSQYPFPNVLWHVKPAEEMAIKSSMMILVGVSGIFLNCVILTILIRNKWLWSPSNCLIGNMALIDFLLLFFCPWFMLVRDFFQNYVLKTFGCRFEGFLQASLLLASVGAVMLVSYDRLAAAVLTAEARITKDAAPKVIVITWIVSSALALPWTIKRKYVERQWLNYLETFCAEDVQLLGIYWHLLLTMLVWVPLGIMIITYGVIMWRLQWSARALSSRGGGRSVTRAKGKAMRIAALVLIAAVVCRIPYTALLYWRNNLPPKINSVDGSFSIMWFAANYLMYLNCTINPLIYGFTNLRFRKAMDRTPGVACFKFGSWCCVCTFFKRRNFMAGDKNTEKIFVIENSPGPNKKLSRVVKNILHINKDSIEFSIKIDEMTTKPTKLTPLKNEQF
ncbi:neuropeptide receptor 22 [Bombyx mandarina]|uniref:Neuropeptide receptor A34 n=2 Tax=Bombyx TaxID=7090 RepID=B3XXP7_BOMMO|nr:neuropeptide receptor A34 [Bombyx mori]XP_028029369.1 neuropeptide receptor 22 [Bombyx mandarina]BAG68433.1 neuropeptide receptor A34 [Bombyx mori]